MGSSEKALKAAAVVLSEELVEKVNKQNEQTGWLKEDLEYEFRMFETKDIEGQMNAIGQGLVDVLQYLLQGSDSTTHQEMVSQLIENLEIPQYSISSVEAKLIANQLVNTIA